MSVLTNKGLDFIGQLESTTIDIPSGERSRLESFLKSAELPTTRDEAWKYTRLGKLNRYQFSSDKFPNAPENWVSINSDAIQIHVVNGNIVTDIDGMDLPEGLSIKRIKNSGYTGDTNVVSPQLFEAINLLFLSDGLLVETAKNQVVNRPIEVVHVQNGNEVISNFRIVIKAADFSELEMSTVFLSNEKSENCFSNISLDVETGINAAVIINKLQYENETSFHIATENIEQEKDSTFTINTVTLNGQLVRNDLSIRVNGENATTNLNGAYLLKENQHTDNHTTVDHKVPNCTSNELYKGVIDGKATAVFNGKVFVRPQAQKINAFQSNANILLSDDATINSKPELEIYADDVKCSHGSSTGQLDEEAVFYLRSRGLSERSARKLLVSAFISDVLTNVKNEGFTQFVEECINDRFGY